MDACNRAFKHNKMTTMEFEQDCVLGEPRSPHPFFTTCGCRWEASHLDCSNESSRAAYQSHDCRMDHVQISNDSVRRITIKKFHHGPLDVRSAGEYTLIWPRKGLNAFRSCKSDSLETSSIAVTGSSQMFLHFPDVRSKRFEGYRRRLVVFVLVCVRWHRGAA